MGVATSSVAQPPLASSEMPIPPEQLPSINVARISLQFSEIDESDLAAREIVRNFNETGFALSRSERELFDSRLELVDLATSWLEIVGNRAGFTGAELVHEGTGRLVVYVSSESASDFARTSVPDEIADVVDIRMVDRSLAELESIMTGVWSQVGDAGLEGVLDAIWITPSTGGFLVELVGDEGPARAASDAEVIRELTIAPTTVEFTDGDSQSACTGRETCTGPMRAGNAIRRGSNTGPRCSMGFHVVRNGDEQFLNSTTSGRLARIEDALTLLGVTLKTS